MQQDHLDVDALKELREVMEDEFSVLIETYVKDSVMRVDSLYQALEAGDTDELRKAAHSFKGSCGNIGAQRLAEMCSQVEEAGRKGALENVSELVEHIAQEFEEVKKLMEAL